MYNVRNEMWYKDALLPEIRTMTPVKLDAVKNFKISKTQADIVLILMVLKMRKHMLYIEAQTQLHLMFLN